MKKNHFLTLFCIGFAISACGGSGKSDSNSVDLADKTRSSESHPNKSSQDKPSPNTVVGPCTVTGNIRSFQISCDKSIQNFTVGFLTSGKGIQRSGVINGTRYDTNIQNEGTRLVGHEGADNSLDIIINFTDSSTASITMRAE